MDIILTTVNATYQHASLGLRYLFANMGDLRERTVLREYTSLHDPKEIALELKRECPRIIGIGVYIWNVNRVSELVGILRAVMPEVIIILGGPEVSFEPECTPAVALADCVISGEADLAFAEVCRRFLAGDQVTSRIRPVLPELGNLVFPYQYLSVEDLKNRFVYVEASRGCAYKCEFCLSALDEKVRYFPGFLNELGLLFDRGARHFKFVDRTFNLHPHRSREILEFFLARIVPDLFLHFEMVPDRFPEELKSLIERYPPGVLQFEVGVQTWDPAVAVRISRRQDYAQIANNLRYLREKTGVHVHADLIVGLSSETVEGFGRGFDALYALRPHEIQVGLLKRLKGTPLCARDRENVYESHAPFRILRTPSMTFEDIQELARLAKFWDLIGNSGNFVRTVELMAAPGASIFDTFRRLSRHLHTRHPQPWGVALSNLCGSVWSYLKDLPFIDEETLRRNLLADYSQGGRRHTPDFLRHPTVIDPTGSEVADASANSIGLRAPGSSLISRQKNHGRGQGSHGSTAVPM